VAKSFFWRRANHYTERTMPAITKELLLRLGAFDTALLANTIGVIDATPVHEWYMGGSIQSVTPSLGPTCGVAYTCELDSSTPGGQAAVDDYWTLLDRMEEDDRPAVLVVRTVGERPDHECVLGDGMARHLYTVGCIGVVTDGGVRDVPGLLTVPFAAYSRGCTIHHGALRFRAAGQPIELGGIVVGPGDIVHADSGGVITIPAGCAERLPGEAIRMLSFEREAHMLLRRTDLRSAGKRGKIQELLAGYGFTKTCTANDRA
jgi:4-hydroxy-4-methyl-2-oxoglutarate aldolase